MVIFSIKLECIGSLEGLIVKLIEPFSKQVVFYSDYAPQNKGDEELYLDIRKFCLEAHKAWFSYDLRQTLVIVENN